MKIELPDSLVDKVNKKLSSQGDWEGTEDEWVAYVVYLIKKDMEIKVEFDGYIEEIKYENYDGVNADIVLKIRIYKPVMPFSPGFGAAEEVLEKYRKEVEEVERKIKDFYKFRIGKVKLIQEDD